MSRNYELIRKAGDAIHAHRGTGRYTPPSPPRVPVAEVGTAGEQTRDLDLNIGDLVQAIVRRRAWIYACTAAMLLAAGLVCLFMTPKYKAESKLEILKQDTTGLSLKAGADDGGSDPLDFNMTLQTQLAVLKSDVLAWQVMKELKLTGSKGATDAKAAGVEPETNAGRETAGGSIIAPDKESARALKKFKSNLKVSTVSGTRLIAVSYLDRDPHMAAKIVNQLVSDFIEYNFRVRLQRHYKSHRLARTPVG